MKRSFHINMPKVETFDRDLVIKQATDVFHNKGYNATSMQDLVDATGLNRSSIYNSFESKLNLFIDCLTAYQNKYHNKTSNVLLDAKNPINAIELLFQLYKNEMLKDKDNKGCMIINCKSEMANHNERITNFLLQNQKNTLLFLEDLISKGQKEHYINSDKSAQDYAIYLFSALQGFRMTGIMVQDKNQLESIVNTTIQTLV